MLDDGVARVLSVYTCCWRTQIITQKHKNKSSINTCVLVDLGMACVAAFLYHNLQDPTVHGSPFLLDICLLDICPRYDCLLLLWCVCSIVMMAVW